MKKKLMAVALLFAFLLQTVPVWAVTTKQFPAKYDVPRNKVWTVKFNKKARYEYQFDSWDDVAVITNLDTGEKSQITYEFDSDRNYIEIGSTEKWEPGSHYRMTVGDKILSADGKCLTPATMEFYTVEATNAEPVDFSFEGTPYNNEDRITVSNGKLHINQCFQYDTSNGWLGIYDSTEGVEGVYLVTIIKGTKVDMSNFYSIDGYLKTDIYLPFGPGEYELKISFKPVRCIPQTNSNLFDPSLCKSVLLSYTGSELYQYICPGVDIQSNNKEIIDFAQEITLDCKDDYEKAKAISSWITNNIDYGYDQVENARLKIGHQDALTVLSNKKGVCEGFSKLTAALLRSTGIKTAYIKGINTQSGNLHAWNAAFIDNRWVLIDNTWGIYCFDMNEKDFEQNHSDIDYSQL